MNLLSCYIEKYAINVYEFSFEKDCRASRDIHMYMYEYIFLFIITSLLKDFNTKNVFFGNLTGSPFILLF